MTESVSFRNVCSLGFKSPDVSRSRPTGILWQITDPFGLKKNRNAEMEGQDGGQEVLGSLKDGFMETEN